MKARVLVFGTFDLLHPGHIQFLEEASLLGKIFVVLTPDELCKKFKGHYPVNKFLDRKKRLENLGCIFAVYSADSIPGSYNILKKINPDIILLGYDQGALRKRINDKIIENKLKTKVIIGKPYRPEIYKSRIFRNTPNSLLKD